MSKLSQDRYVVTTCKSSHFVKHRVIIITTLLLYCQVTLLYGYRHLPCYAHMYHTSIRKMKCGHLTVA